jgi:hypothetical protein
MAQALHILKIKTQCGESIMLLTKTAGTIILSLFLISSANAVEANCFKLLTKLEGPGGSSRYYCTYICYPHGSDAVSCMTTSAPFEDCLGMKPVNPFEEVDPNKVKADYDSKCEDTSTKSGCQSTCYSGGEEVCTQPCEVVY